MKRLLRILPLILLVFMLASCQKQDATQDLPNPIATITLDDGSEMHFELYYSAAPFTVGNFIALANDGFYDGLKFFRVVPGVLIQAGDPNNDGTGGAGYTIRGEFSSNGFGNDNPSHLRGTISMARLESDANSASSQFFIMQGNYPEYDGQYASFGRAMDEETLNVIDTIASQAVDSKYSPIKAYTIRTIRVNTHDLEYPYQTMTD